MKTNLENIKELLSSYFHQDWRDEYENETLAIQAIIAMEPIEQIALAISEIEEVISLNMDDESLKKFTMINLGCYFNPEIKGLTYDEWLLEIRDAFKSATEI